MDENTTSQAADATNAPSPVRSKRVRRLVVGLVVVGVLVGGAAYALKAAVSTLITPERVVSELESRYNARFYIGSIEVSLFSAPAKIRISDVQVGHRDNVANKGTSLASRGKIPTPVVRFDTVEMDVSLSALVARRIEVSELRFVHGSMLGRMRSSGEMTLSVLVDPPKVVNGNPVGEKSSSGPTSAGGKSGDDGDLFYFAGVDNVDIQNTDIQLLINKRKTLLIGQGLDLRIGKVEMSEQGEPIAQLVPVELTGKVRVARAKDDFELALFDLAGKAGVELVTDGEGSEVAGVDMELTVGDGSSISVLPTLTKVRKKLEKLESSGIKLDGYLADRVTFPAGGSRLVVRMEDNVIRSSEPFVAEYGNFDLDVAKGGEVNLADNRHKFGFSVVGDDKVSMTVLGQIDDKKKMLPEGQLRDQFVADVKDSLFSDGLLSLDFSSTGRMSKPDVDFDNKLPEPKDYLKGLLDQLGSDPKALEQLEDAGSELLKGLIK